MASIADMKASAQKRERRFFWHWQNLNDKRDGPKGSGLRHGRCWWNFSGRNIQFCWNLWTHFCGVGFDIDDQDATFHVSFPPVAFWLSFDTRLWPFSKWPKQPLSETYPNTFVIAERTAKIAIHGGKLWISPWERSGEWRAADPWWVRGVSFQINPFELRHMRHEVRRPDGSWAPFVGSWEGSKVPDGRQEFELPYRYVLNSGEVQHRTATVFVDRRAWRPLCMKWTGLFEKAIQTIDVCFNDEVGERSGSWKGGCTGCNYAMLPGETPAQTLNRMQRDRKF